MLVGLQGSGKTTTAAKIALHLKTSGQQPLLVAADTRRPAAFDQLLLLGKQLDIPVYGDSKEVASLAICRRALELAQRMGAKWVIVDTQGRLHIDEDMMAELVQLKKELQPSEILLVVDAMSGQDALNVAGEFHRRLGLTGMVLTKMDGDARGGAALSIKSVIGVPIKFVGTGEKADALEVFYPDRLASRILGMGDVLTLIEKAEKLFSDEQARQAEKKLRAASFDLEDLLWQLRQFRKMGGVAQMVGLLPGLSSISSRVLHGDEEQRLRSFEAIILSMTPEERRNPDIIDGSRRRRIARGSGTTPRDVNQLLAMYYQARKLSKMAAKGKIPRGLLGLSA
jgi:signal recognition particle subunit SRP54